MMNIEVLFALAKLEWAKRQQGRLRGKHCKARLQRAQAKRVASGKKAYTPQD